MWFVTGSLAVACAWCLTIVPAWGIPFWIYLVLGLIALAAALCNLGLLIWDALDDTDPALRAARVEVADIIDWHLDTLAQRRVSLVTVDHYGVADTKGWEKELRHFVRKVVEPSLTAESLEALTKEGKLVDVVIPIIDERVGGRADDLEIDLEFDPRMTPTEFEQWCAARLAQAGWKTRTVGASGDQGADVIAERSRLRAVIQCKLYRTPVGNKAVQEAFAAKRHYSADIAAVVTSSSFTPSARRLSATTGVLLLLHTEIDRFDEMLEAAEERAGEHFRVGTVEGA